MKIGIMTFPNMTSCGCSMQMYGLYRAVEPAEKRGATLVVAECNYFRCLKNKDPRVNVALDISSRTNSRLNQLVEITDIQNRIIGDHSAHWDETVDYGKVEARLAPERESFLGYLKQAIGQ